MAEAALPVELDDEVFGALAERLGEKGVLLDAAARELHGQDVSGDASPVRAVVRPRSTAELVEILRFADRHGLAVVPRGGGMSYSSGYVCKQAPVLCLDMAGMDAIEEINTEDMYVTVQAGCTWAKLHEALAPLGVRTPYWGTLSGIQATVGGSLSQNSLFWGSGRYGSAADSVVGFAVVLANGEVLRTGAGAQVNAVPFFRHYGPDLTGLFTCDAGALGIKAEVTLKLITAAAGRAHLSFDFASHRPLFRAISEVSRQGLAEACFGFDPVMQAQRLQRESLMRDIQALRNVVKRQEGLVKGLKEGAKVAMAGRRFMKDVDFSLHFMVDEASQAAAEAAAERIRAICAKQGGKEIENSIPKIARANPFGPLNSMIGPAGERWLPVHGLLPHSKAIAAYEAVEALFAANQAVLDRHGILHGTLFTYADTNCFVIEPVFYWPDQLNALHRQSVDEAVLKRVNDFPENLEARTEVMRLRTEIMDLFKDYGAAHLQIGRRYPYQEGLRETPLQLVRALKKLLDPEGRINPGALISVDGER